MGLLSNKSKSSKGKVADTLIAEGTVITGNIVFAGVLYLDGRVNGNLLGEEGSDARLFVSARGHIEGQVRAPRVVVNGEIRGDIHAEEELILEPQARVHGDVHYKTLQMQVGAQVNGKLVHREHKPPLALEHKRHRGERSETALEPNS